ncbi:hypothetical protein pb186bvf_015269 [Paramecium bursaria]
MKNYSKSLKALLNTHMYQINSFHKNIHILKESFGYLMLSQQKLKPIGLLTCSDTRQKYKKIELFKDLKVLIGLNDDCRLELQEDKIKLNMAMIEHKFNSFLLQSLSDCCYYKGQCIQKDSIIILRENDILEFWYYNYVWQYQFDFVKSSPSKNRDSQLKSIIQADNGFLEKTLQCGICFEILQRPVQIQCNHSFCGHCLSYQMNYQFKCPTCRSEIKSITIIKSLDKLSRVYLRKHPEKAKSLELQQMYEQQNRFYNKQYKVDSYISQEDLEQVQQPQCKSCSSKYNDYVCLPGQQHVQCCNYLLPIRHLSAVENTFYKMFCQVCKIYSCRHYYQTECSADWSLSLQDWILGIQLGLYSQVFLHQVLQDKIQEYLKGLTFDYILNFVIRDCVQKLQFYLEGSQKQMISNRNELLLVESPLCIHCMNEALFQMILKFFELNKMAQGLQNCQHGIHCQACQFFQSLLQEIKLKESILIIIQTLQKNEI